MNMAFPSATNAAIAGRSGTLMECGGKRSATPLSYARKSPAASEPSLRSKAVSPLRSATALQIPRRVGVFSAPRR